MVWFKESVSHKKKFLASLLKAPLARLDNLCGPIWSDPDKLTATLQNHLCKLPHCQLLYAIEITGKQISANVTRNGIDNTWLGQDLSLRPYLKGNLPYKGLVLSAAYMSQRTMQPCITSVQSVRDEGGLRGFIAADFHLKDLPNVTNSPLQSIQWEQCRAGPSIRSTALMQQRHNSSMDENIDYLIYVFTTLIQEHGVFHCQLHFSSARCTLWTSEEPHCYRLHSVEELMNPELFLLYPKQEYDSRALIDAEKVPLVLAQLKALRSADDTIYLRSASLNIMNGLLGLTLSCDGSHYMNVDEFLNRDLALWMRLPNEKTDELDISTPN